MKISYHIFRFLIAKPDRCRARRPRAEKEPDEHLFSLAQRISTYCQNNQQIMMIGRLAVRSAARAAARQGIASSFRAQAVRALASSTSPLLSEAAADATTSIPQDPAMFCRQCEQAREGVGCSTIGVCGKSPEASNAQDALIHFIKSVSSWCVAARDAGATAQDMAEANAWTLKAAFATLTNVNFSEVRQVAFVCLFIFFQY